MKYLNHFCFVLIERNTVTLVFVGDVKYIKNIDMSKTKLMELIEAERHENTVFWSKRSEKYHYTFTPKELQAIIDEACLDQRILCRKMFERVKDFLVEIVVCL